MPFLEGLLVGLALIIFVGPVFFTLLQSALQKGFKTGFAVAFGIFISDVVCVGLCLLGASSYINNPAYTFYIAIGGAAILIAVGAWYLFKTAKLEESEIKLRKRDLAGYFMKGFLVNFINPFVFGVWIGIIAIATEKYGEGDDRLIYLGAVLLGILITDTLKAAFANKIKVFLKPLFLNRIYQTIGLVLIGIGIWILVAM